MVQNLCLSLLGVQSIRPPSRIRLEKVVTQVDVRGREEQAVSMIPGAVTKEFFEAEVLPQLRAQTSQAEQQLVVPYCTVAGF